MNTISFVKIIPHLQLPIVQQRQTHVYSTVFTPQIAKYLAGLSVLSAENLGYSEFLQLLAKSGRFTKVPAVANVGQYSVKGDTVIAWLEGYDLPIRVEFFAETLESVKLFDQDLGRPGQSLEHILINADEGLDADDQPYVHINLDQDYGNSSELDLVIFSPVQHDLRGFVEGDLASSFVAYDYQIPSLFWKRFDMLQKEIERWQAEGYYVEIQSQHADVLAEKLPSFDFDVTGRPAGSLVAQLSNPPAGYISAREKVVLLTDREIFGTIYLQSQSGSENSQKLLRQLEGEISIGDYIVHESHGVGIYAGLTQEEVGGFHRDYLQIKYAGDDELLIPIEQVAQLTKYIGNDGMSPKISSLGKGKNWETLTQKVKKSVAIKAKELVEHYARRELAQAQTVDLTDSKEYQKFVADFPYDETKDQLHATDEIISDLSKSTPMNRLLVGDVGFGKTEVAMRAAFKAVESGMQVAVLCPTTVLCTQHQKVFTQRFANTNYKVAAVSRFNTSKENQQIIAKANSADIDILIGTHRLLSNDVRFKNLGLIVVDEEQRFGVAQKEKIKQLNYGVHQLSISATPIPRTLGMALSSIQDLSIINQAPANRKPVQTSIVSNWSQVAAAISRELERGGQIYFVHNRVQSLPSIQARIEKLIPGIKVLIGHGQMPVNQLDKTMNDFYNGKADLLLSTTIIENGLDLPNVNTMVINQAEKFGLAQLYQLRGRVGRSPIQAYCYLISSKQVADERDLQHTSADSKQAEIKKSRQRLEALVNSSKLGAGFGVASRDLEIRGAGDLLGEKQHGHISQVGYALYMRLLAQEIDRLKLAKQELERRPEFVTL